MTKHLLLLGFNYQNRRATGDKNFWLDLVGLFAKRFRRISIISIREHEVDREEFQLGNCRVVTHYMPPIFERSRFAAALGV